MANLYRLEYKVSQPSGARIKPMSTEIIVEFFAADDDAAARTEVNNRMPARAIDIQFHNVGTEVSLE